VPGKKVAFHSDATQVLGKVRIDVEDTLVDFLTMAAHKLYGPKGNRSSLHSRG